MSLIFYRCFYSICTAVNERNVNKIFMNEILIVANIRLLRIEILKSVKLNRSLNLFLNSTDISVRPTLVHYKLTVVLKSYELMMNASLFHLTHALGHSIIIV